MSRYIRFFACVVSFCLTLTFSGCGGRAEESSTGAGSQAPSFVDSSSETESGSGANGPSEGSTVSETHSNQQNTPSNGASTSKASPSGAASNVKPSSQVTTSTQKPPASSIPYITKGLIARYDFEDGENIGKDASGNGNHLWVWNESGKTVGQVSNSLNNALGKAAKFGGGALLAAKKLEDSKTPLKGFRGSNQMQ